MNIVKKIFERKKKQPKFVQKTLEKERKIDREHLLSLYSVEKLQADRRLDFLLEHKEGKRFQSWEGALKAVTKRNPLFSPWSPEKMERMRKNATFSPEERERTRNHLLTHYSIKDLASADLEHLLDMAFLPETDVRH